MNNYEPEDEIHCPICQEKFSDDSWCDHLVISSDDSDLVEQCVQFAGVGPVWAALREESTQDYIGQATAFASSFVDSCSSAARVDQQTWDGGYPGLSGVWTFVWTADPEKLKKEIGEKLTAELERVRRPKPEPVVALEGLAEKILELTRRQGGVVVTLQQEELSLVGSEVEFEGCLAYSPSPEERQKRRHLLRLAGRALDHCRDRHPLCLQALKAVKLFCAGKSGFRELAVARSLLQGRVTAAGCVGLPHRIPNAAATLVCYYACHPNLDEAIRLTEEYYARTLEFAESRSKDAGAQKTNVKLPPKGEGEN